MSQLSARIFEEELAVDHEQNPKKVEEEKEGVSNNDIAVESENHAPVRRQEAQPIEQKKANYKEDDNSEQSDIGNH
jgi:hypothetical protein